MGEKLTVAQVKERLGLSLTWQPRPEDVIRGRCLGRTTHMICMALSYITQENNYVMFRAHTLKYAWQITGQARECAKTLRMADGWILDPTNSPYGRAKKVQVYTDHYRTYMDGLEQHAGRIISPGAQYEAEKQRLERAREEAMLTGKSVLTGKQITITPKGMEIKRLPNPSSEHFSPAEARIDTSMFRPVGKPLVEVFSEEAAATPAFTPASYEKHLAHLTEQITHAFQLPAKAIIKGPPGSPMTLKTVEELRKEYGIPPLPRSAAQREEEPFRSEVLGMPYTEEPQSPLEMAHGVAIRLGIPRKYVKQFSHLPGLVEAIRRHCEEMPEEVQRSVPRELREQVHALQRMVDPPIEASLGRYSPEKEHMEMAKLYALLEADEQEAVQDAAQKSIRASWVLQVEYEEAQKERQRRLDEIKTFQDLAKERKDKSDW